jgi:hypothetical protein
MIREYKGYQIKPDAQSPTLFKVVTAGQGGKIPDVLDSLFTSAGLAMREIDNYLVLKEQRNGKASEKGGSK